MRQDSEREITPRRLVVERTLVNLVLVTAAVALAFGLAAPLLTTTKFWVFHETTSILGAVGKLWSSGDVLLAGVIVIFSVAVPALKLILLTAAWNRRRSSGSTTRRLVSLMSIVGKWSMLEVFVLALVIVSVKSGGVIQTKIHSAVYVFTFSVILTKLAAARVLSSLCPRSSLEGSG